MGGEHFWTMYWVAFVLNALGGLKILHVYLKKDAEASDKYDGDVTYANIFAGFCWSRCRLSTCRSAWLSFLD